MKWNKIKSEEEAYQSESGDIIIVTKLDSASIEYDDELPYEVRLIYDDYSQEIKLQTSGIYKDRIVKLLQKKIENNNNNFNLI